ncbi:glycosyltransferase family 2 protein [Campylobacter lari]|nr:glycosyltransferase family 2 protein [Campylobacter lari]EAL7139348.1 glycosyltransferase family 2 protein [Campylobacter lari]
MSQISIILPTYNVEKYIARALDSCINQSFEDIEIIVVDDNGSDKSIDIAKEYASKDKRIKIIHNEENLKLLRARCEGVKVATSPYIMFLDPDDYLELNACEECIKISDKDNKVDLIFFDAFVLNNNSKIERKLNFQEKYYTKKDFLKKLLKTKNLFWTMWGKVIKKELYLKAFSLIPIEKDTKINMAEDALLYYPLINTSNHIFYLERALYNYCINPTSICNLKTLENINKNIEEQNDVLNILKYIQNKNNFNLGLFFLIKYLLLLEKFTLQYKTQFRIYNKVMLFTTKYIFKFFYILKK